MSDLTPGEPCDLCRQFDGLVPGRTRGSNWPFVPCACGYVKPTDPEPGEIRVVLVPR